MELDDAEGESVARETEAKPARPRSGAAKPGSHRPEGRPLQPTEFEIRGQKSEKKEFVGTGRTVLRLWQKGRARGATRENARLYRECGGLYTFFVSPWRRAIGFVTLSCLLVMSREVGAQESAAKPAAKSATQAPAEKETPSKPQLPFQIQLLETHIRFEANGDSRKEVHTIVKINNILGVQEFGRLSFDYNRSFQQVEIPLVRVSHANGGTSEVLPSAVTDTVNAVAAPFPAYQDVRVKTVRVLGLQDGDTVEYRVITTTTKHPLAPDFWVEHTFDRSGQVLQELYKLDLPGHVQSTTRAAGRDLVSVHVPYTDYRNIHEGKDERSIFEWKIRTSVALPEPEVKNGVTVPDVLVNQFLSSLALADRIVSRFPKWSEEDQKASESWLTVGGPLPVSAEQKMRLSYGLVAQRLATVDLPPDANGFGVRAAKQILESGYATAEEKCYLLAQFARSAGLPAEIVLYGEQVSEQEWRPKFQKVFVLLSGKDRATALDPSMEVAPYGMISAEYRGKRVMSLTVHSGGDYGYHWLTLPDTLPFRAKQDVRVSAEIGDDGNLAVKVKYLMRGDNELTLRTAFHQTPKERWKDVANLLAISDGFRGQIVSVNASDPMETKDPFTVEYELTQPKFVDWSKKPVRIPALLPQIGLPDLPVAGGAGQNAAIQLGTPLDVQATMTLRLPAGTTVETPPGTSVERDYAAFTSKYASTANTATATRHIEFLKREIAGDQAIDYATFVHAVQNDQVQRFVLAPIGNRK